MGEVCILFKPIKTREPIKSGFEEEALINQEWEGALIAQFVPLRVPGSCLDGEGGGLMRSKGERCRNVAKIMGWVVTGRERQGRLSS